MSSDRARGVFGIPDDARRVSASILRMVRSILEPDAAYTAGAPDVSLKDSPGNSMESVLADVDEIARSSINPRHPDTIAHMVQPPATIAVLGDLLIGALNQCAFTWEQGPAVAAVEREVLSWMARRLTLSEGTSSLLTSGGTASNMLAFFLARSNREVTDDRRSGPMRAIASDQAHLSIDKAAALVGLGRDAVVRIPTDGDGRLRPGQVMRTAQRVKAMGCVPFLFLATIGTSNAGVVEPAEEYIEAARRFGAWTHFDAAHGGLLALCGRDQVPWSAADSVSWDPHKSLFVSFASGALFVRDPRALDALAFRSEYALERGESDDVGYRHLDGARRFEALKIWMVIRHLGLARIREFSERKIELAAAFVAELRRSGRFHVFTEPDLNIVCFQFTAPGLSASEIDALNLAIKDALFRSGSLLLSATRLGGRVALRAIFNNPALEFDRLRATVSAIECCGDELLAAAQKEVFRAGSARYKSAS
jgi:L-2,4-diaminobutyrate decarboxylase